MNQITLPYNETTQSKQPALELLQAMGYMYLTPEQCALQRGNHVDVLLKDILRGQLRKINRYHYAGIENEFSAANIERAIEDLDEPLSDGLARTSEKIYDALMLGKSYPETVGGGKTLSFDLRFIDWDHPENNVFHVTEEYAVDSLDRLHNARPDIVLFVNGIPFAIVECKAPDVPVEQGIEQTLRNQMLDGTPQLYKYAQIVMTTNKNSAQYATTDTPKQFWNIWKEQDTEWLDSEWSRLSQNRVQTAQDITILSLFTPQRILELTRYFVLYDASVKKICRYQQYFAVKEIIKTINNIDSHGNRQSGVIWHTQGSGKSLTMVMLANYILTELADCSPKVVVVTDRKELDRQIARTFSHTRLKPARATSGRNLVSLIGSDKADVVTTIINKFDTADRLEIQNSSYNIFVLVDESHRSNYGQFAAKMRAVFPHACFIGFTGTPLMKDDKSTVAKFGGNLIHKYTIQDGVDDHAIVPLIYEGRFVDQKVDEANIDLWFDETTQNMSAKAKSDLGQKWSSLRQLNSSKPRISRIALDIKKDYLQRLAPTAFNAMLATNSKKDAVRYLQSFEALGGLHCAVIVSAPDMREGIEDTDDGITDEVVAFWDKMMRKYGNDENYEETIKNEFCDGDIDILIVCGKLLTGFDAPLCQVLYIDKELRDHGLLQAIARTNRLYDGKDFGLVIDYRGLIQELDSAMDVYSGSGLEDFNGADLHHVAVDIMESVASLRQAYTQLTDFFSAVNNKQDDEAIELFLGDESKREDFYSLLLSLGRSLSLVLNSETAPKELPREELKKYKDTFARFSRIRRAVKIRYGDAVDYREYEAQMQGLLDTHLSVAGLRQITNPVDILNKSDFEQELKELGTFRAKADAIASRITKNINAKYDENPAFYDSFAKRIQKTLQQYKDRVINDAQLLEKMQSILEDYARGKSDIHYPEKIKSNVHAQAFYGVIAAILDGEINIADKADLLAEISLKVTEIVEQHSQVDWTNNQTIHDRIAQDIDDLFFHLEKEENLHLSFDIIDKIIENVKTVALRRF